MELFFKILGCWIIFSYSLAASTINKSLENGNFELIILHNNDMHARFEQTNAFSNRCKDEDIKKNKCYGGFARVAHLIREYRSKAEQGISPKVLYLNAGDTYTGTPWFSIFKDNITATFLDLLKPDAISLGNHEFDEGTENLANFLNQIKFPVLAANLILDEEPKLKNKTLKPSHIFTIDGTKIGVIGYLTPETKEVASPNKVEFTNEVTAINEEAENLKKQGVHIIIALGHSGIERDKEIAHDCPHIDLVIGGHSHTFLYDGMPPDVEVPFDNYPISVIQKTGKTVPVVQSYAYTKYLGYLHLKFDKDGNLVEIDGTPILLNGTIERESDILEMLEVYRPAVLELQNQVVGYTRVHLDGNCRRRECNLGNFIADSMVDWNAQNYGGKGWTDVAIGMIQGGGVRASIEKNSAGITMEDLETVSPFKSKIVVIEIIGKTLLEALEHSVHRYTDREERGEFLQYSGLTVEYDMNQPVGKRVVIVKVLCAYCEVPEFKDVAENEKYRIVMQDFLANGGDGFSMFKNSQIKESEALDVDVLRDYIAKKTPIYPAVENRIVIKDVVNPSDEILGKTRVFLDGNCYKAECNLGNFITDAIIDWYSLNFDSNEGWTRSSIALIPANNIKHSIDNKLNHGVVTKQDAMEILPLNNKIVVVNITGYVLQEVLEYSIHRYAQGVHSVEFLQMSGIYVEYDVNNVIGKRVQSLKTICSSCAIPILEDIKLDKYYSVLMPDNMANGGLGFTILRNRTLQVLDINEIDVFSYYFKRKSPIYPSVEWRITLYHVDPLQNIVGTTRVDLSNDCILRECNLGNFITDSMVDWYASNYNGKGWTDAAIAIVEGSKIKYSIDANLKNGTIYRSDVENIFDPSYNLQVLSLKGSELISLLEYSVSTYGDPKHKDLLQVSGIQLVFDMSKPSGHRITDIKVLCSYCDLPELRQINKTEDYKIIVQSSLISDKDYEITDGKKVDDLGETDINVFLQYLKKKSPIYPGIEWRITIVEHEQPNESTTTTDNPTTPSLAASNSHISILLILIPSVFSIVSI